MVKETDMNDQAAAMCLTSHVHSATQTEVQHHLLSQQLHQTQQSSPVISTRCLLNCDRLCVAQSDAAEASPAGRKSLFVKLTPYFTLFE